MSGHVGPVAVLGALVVVLFVGGGAGPPVDAEGLEGRAPTPIELQPGIEAAFPRQSYAPGSVASLVLFGSAPNLTVRLFQVGPEQAVTRGVNEMRGVPVTRLRRVGTLGAGGSVRIPIGEWPSGLYFARLTSTDGLIGFAPFVVRPRFLGEHRVAVVLPTLTWQAYNLRDDDGDGIGNSWYARWSIHTVQLGRPFLNRGVPYNFRRYDLPFLHWLAAEGKQVDVLSDADLDSVPDGWTLAENYDLVVFPGHHEYVTTHEYDVVEGYRNFGGNLIFMYSNNFFWQVVEHGNVIERTKQWRDLGRPEAALIGVQYCGSKLLTAPWVVRKASADEWLFAGTGLRPGSPFGCGGIEIDKTASVSPGGTEVVAEIPKLFGPRFTAQMTYYETSAGARVFAAGAFRLLTLPIQHQISRLLENLWVHMTSDALAST